MRVSLTLENTLDNQQASRLIKDTNKEKNNNIEVSFSNDLKKIVLEGDTILVPDARVLNQKDVSFTGEVHCQGEMCEITAKEKGKTVNLHLDSHLVQELEQIRQYVSSKTQHDVLLEIFKRGIKELKAERSD